MNSIYHIDNWTCKTLNNKVRIDSDAVFNLGAAVSSVQILEPGVYICMNGLVFLWDNVMKNRKTGRFEKKN